LLFFHREFTWNVPVYCNLSNTEPQASITVIKPVKPLLHELCVLPATVLFIWQQQTELHFTCRQWDHVQSIGCQWILKQDSTAIHTIHSNVQSNASSALTNDHPSANDFHDFSSELSNDAKWLSWSVSAIMGWPPLPDFTNVYQQPVSYTMQSLTWS